MTPDELHHHTLKHFAQRFEDLEPGLIGLLGKDGGTLLLALACRLLAKTRGKVGTAEMLRNALVRYSEPGDYFDARMN